MSKIMQQALQSVVDLHILIEDVFTGRNGDNSLAPLLASFDTHFEMVTTQGSSIGLDKVTALFSNNIGKKTTLKIECLNCQPLREDNGYCWVQYQEKQQINGTESLRISTACIKVEAEKCVWLYLHETPVV